MYDIHRRDRQVFVRELLRFGPIYLTLMVVLIVSFFFNPFTLFFGSLILVWVVLAAHKRSVPKRFYSPRFLHLWNGCTDRLKRFEGAITESKKGGVPELQELPKTVAQVNQSLYLALRRADIVLREVTNSEGWLVLQRQGGGPISPDQKAQELYRLADKNIAEYRQHYQSVMAGVERAEAQAVVFTTTLDTLRMRMLGHRLAGKSPELAHMEFLQALTEARMQLDSIDKALDELELTPFPGQSTALEEAMAALKSDAEKELDDELERERH